MWAHSLAHKKVQNEQFKQWMQCMQCEFFLGNLVVIDSKRVGPGPITFDTVGGLGFKSPRAYQLIQQLSVNHRIFRYAKLRHELDSSATRC